MNQAAITAYGEQFGLALFGLAVLWLWLKIVRSGIATGKMIPYWTMVSRDDADPGSVQDRFTFWTRTMHWTVLALLAEGLVVLIFINVHA